MLVNVIRGCHCPLLLKTIRDELEKEHKVLEGHRERVRVRGSSYYMQFTDLPNYIPHLLFCHCSLLIQKWTKYHKKNLKKRNQRRKKKRRRKR